jgi:methyl coenzyme M reductase subunit C-like uncharacterized protein (methanogenesis marker protein 7)
MHLISAQPLTSINIELVRRIEFEGPHVMCYVAHFLRGIGARCRAAIGLAFVRRLVLARSCFV